MLPHRFEPRFPASEVALELRSNEGAESHAFWSPQQKAPQAAFDHQIRGANGKYRTS